MQVLMLSVDNDDNTADGDGDVAGGDDKWC